jgi:hypothetical protein
MPLLDADGRATARPVTTFSARWFSAHTSSSIGQVVLDDLPTTRPRWRQAASFSPTSAANLIFFQLPLTVPAPDSPSRPG